ncbi:hypothetical protein JZ751_003718 [Albula glossodonta]|uniref:EGF-like domain-containing protein n=1 Tax=Albula glossodonta TaxID=121402 RepID=A0A8T2P577_9TELE|nr:hypothetical protein JZ751_003718 [Albula glossodonta]
MKLPWGPLLALLAVLAATDALSTPQDSSNEVLKHQEPELTIGQVIQHPTSPAPSSTTASQSTTPVPTPPCPGDQVPLEDSTDCGCPTGLVKQGDKCVCNAGFHRQGAGECKDVDECTGEGQNPCGLHANCTNTPGSFICSCHRGYLKGPDGSCQDVDECALAAVTGLQACVGGAVCRNSPGSFSCSCPLGYVMAPDGRGCVDVDECSFEEQCRREFGNVCVNTPGSYVCQCQPGFRAEAPACVGPVCPEYRVCQDVDECTDSPDVCVGQGVCENTLGSYRCVCELGYRGNGTHCEDENECASGRHGCDTHARCGNIIGSYFCQCYQGFNGDGFSCFGGTVSSPFRHEMEEHYVEECALNNGNCQHNCSNLPGTYQCQCGLGYQLALDGHNCTDVNECLALNEMCEQVCTNTDGSFLCSCLPGYQLHIDGHSCVDIDECKLQQGGCSHGCMNSPGGHSCFCPQPLLLDLDNTTCTNVTSCDLRNGGCGHFCTVRSEGRVHCSCKTGWELGKDQRSCLDVDECGDFTNGGCEQVCVNHPGSFNCSCWEGYEPRTDAPARCTLCLCCTRSVCLHCTCSVYIRESIDQGCENLVLEGCARAVISGDGDLFPSDSSYTRPALMNCSSLFGAASSVTVGIDPSAPKVKTLTAAGPWLHLTRNTTLCPLPSQLCVTPPVRTTECVWGPTPVTALRDTPDLAAQPCALLPVPMEVPACAGTCVCAHLAGLGPAATQRFVNFLVPMGDAVLVRTPASVPLTTLDLSALPVTLCTPSCLNGGRCVDVNKCTCTGGWQGSRCQIEPVQCQIGCKNGGVCVGLNRCRCASGFSGNFCETGECQRGVRQVTERQVPHRTCVLVVAVMTPCVPPCQHGATCSPHNKCTCPEGTAGIRCERLGQYEIEKSSVFTVALLTYNCVVVTTVVSMARAVRKGVRESYVDRCGPLGVHLCTKYRINQARVYLQAYRVGYRVQCPEKKGR